jgi:hypothetical protein
VTPTEAGHTPIPHLGKTFAPGKLDPRALERGFTGGKVSLGGFSTPADTVGFSVRTSFSPLKAAPARRPQYGKGQILGSAGNRRTTLVNDFPAVFGEISAFVSSAVLAKAIRQIKRRRNETPRARVEVIQITPAGDAARKRLVGRIDLGGDSATAQIRRQFISRHVEAFLAREGQRLAKTSPPIGKVVVSQKVALRNLAVESIDGDKFTAIWEQGGQADRRVRFPTWLVAAGDRDVFRVGAEFYWQSGRRIVDGQPETVNELRFRREPPPSKTELDGYRILAEKAIAAQQQAQLEHANRLGQ